MNLTAIIVDDEVNSRAILRNYLAKYCTTVTILGEAASVQETLELLKTNTPDMLFLDVEMPYGNAFDLLEQVPDRTFEIVFVTAYDHYAVDALNAQATYYLLKPIAIDNLIKAVDHVTHIKKKEEKLLDAVLVPKVTTVEGKITIPQQDGFEVLQILDILYCEADDNYTKIYLNKGQKLVSKTLKYFEESLNSHGFLRIHKSYLVNVSKIVRYRKGKGGSVVLSSGKELAVSSSKKAVLLDYFK
ncbi:LytR/AlgR family response regulator transcription factor [Aquimarina muelleri]|uniref:DNA-binding response regulator n=1 Tax=Aquimarina muelleri TaxID=279356 RepID=A0A918JU14_9FLAO|nr:LytTR family DNA-binding domain-containing protein [Aquimarina muelleri]MCX2761473.1 LytTR family DNA-binding domain-containing protein [Aquimarina muelleri]GGX13982.1 DNA-binding response regulator [Aquimarina muelleri]